MTLIGDAAEREVAVAMAQMGFELVYQSRACPMEPCTAAGLSVCTKTGGSPPNHPCTDRRKVVSGNYGRRA